MQNFHITWQLHYWAHIQRTLVFQRHMYTAVFILASITVAEIQKQPQCPFMGESTSKIWISHLWILAGLGNLPQKWRWCFGVSESDWFRRTLKPSCGPFMHQYKKTACYLLVKYYNKTGPRNNMPTAELSYRNLGPFVVNDCKQLHQTQTSLLVSY